MSDDDIIYLPADERGNVIGVPASVVTNALRDHTRKAVDSYAVNMAIIRALGIDPDADGPIFSVRLEVEQGSWPMLTIVRPLTDTDQEMLELVTDDYQLVPRELHQEAPPHPRHTQENTP